MVGAQALVAYQTSEGLMLAYTSSIEAYRTQLPETQLSFSVSEISAKRRDNEVVIFAILQLPENRTSVNHVWQVGPMLDGQPLPHDMHGDSLQALGTIDFLCGSAHLPRGYGGEISRSTYMERYAFSGSGLCCPLGC